MYRITLREAVRCHAIGGEDAKTVFEYPYLNLQFSDRILAYQNECDTNPIAMFPIKNVRGVVYIAND